MAQNDFLKRYVDAGVEFTQLTQKRAEAIVRDLVKAGQVRQEQAQDEVAKLLERSRKSSQKLAAQIRAEVKEQVNSLGLATQTELRRLERQIDKLTKDGAAAKKTTATKAPAAKKTAAKKTATAKKPAAKKATATKKAAAKKTA